MDARLTHTMLAQRAAASHTVAGALAPRSSSSALRSSAAAATTGTTTTSADDASDITSSDFLTLLVSELQNQDPTQPTDPNEYITQLAQVNSLEQLISINSGIQTLDSSVPATTTSGSGTSASSSSAANAQAADPQPASAPATLSQIHKQTTSLSAQ